MISLAWRDLGNEGRLNYKSSAVAEMGDRLATIDVGRKVAAAVSLSVGTAGSPSNTVGQLGPHLTQCRLSGGLPLYQVAYGIHPAVWPQYINVRDRSSRL